ncbi:ECF transporter S component [uncultured Anaerotruncus sp.]|uniref:ECF transporter S component n=1 Tax=uncultured Anaerotruncus sp. TaxID=905011 RepID=UPI00280B041A|nr:ECF transporter S component [uncultured Anaerotruncus sp.]
MTNTDHKVKWITRTALCTALVLLAQIIGKLLPAGAVIAGPFSLNQLVTGSLVNLVLILAAASVGLWSGVACGVISSILAALLGMTPVPFIVPAIALGNAVIAVAAWFFFGKSDGTGLRVAGVLVGAGAKCAVLWLTVPAILGMLPNVPPKQVQMLSIMFSWPQFVTALAGGALALAVYPSLRRATGG